jgi:hypothetical protein
MTKNCHCQARIQQLEDELLTERRVIDRRLQTILNLEDDLKRERSRNKGLSADLARTQVLLREAVQAVQMTDVGTDHTLPIEQREGC